MTTLSASARLVVLIAVIVAVAAAPLFLVYRSTCTEAQGERERWALVAPWDDPPEDCRDHESGFEVLREEIGA